MRQDRLKWNEKYQSSSHPDEPASIVRQFARPTGGKRALDIAAGNGRNALFLADIGFAVEAVDISDKGLNLFAGKHPDIHAICVDLDHFDIPAGRYDLIINIKYLNRRLFPYIHEGLSPGGMLIFQTLLDAPDANGDPPVCRDYLLRANELLHAFLPLNIVFYSETEEKNNGEASQLASLVGLRK